MLCKFELAVFLTTNEIFDKIWFLTADCSTYLENWASWNIFEMSSVFENSYQDFPTQNMSIQKVNELGVMQVSDSPVLVLKSYLYRLKRKK